MAVTLGFNTTGQQAAEQFIQQLTNMQTATMKLSEAIDRYDEHGNLLTRSFKGLAEDGTKLDVTLRRTANGIELVTAKTDAATASLKALNDQQKAAEAAARTATANQVESQLTGAGLKGLQTDKMNTNQINAAEAALQRIRAAIESGAVSLQRFQQIYKAITDNPKALIPNMTAEEATLSKALRTLQEGFDVTGDKAARAGQRLLISWQGVLRLFEAQVIKRIAGALQSSLVEGVQGATDFSVRIAEIETISQKANVSTSAWTTGLRRLSEQFGNSQADVAEAAYQSLSNQVTKGADTFQFLETALRFSKATVSSAADSVNLLSSAMRSFNIPTSEAERVAATFFKVIELGRVRAKDMADTFGRVGTVAADAGIKLEEVGAAITTLTTKGMKSSDAFTLISNLILKLVRPTEEMKKLFEEWGVTSGQAAIATFGFGGVLARLDIEAQKGSNRLGELFNQIRAFRAAIGLTGGAFADFQKNFDDIRNGTLEFNNAVEKVTQSFGDRVRRQLNQVKVFFSEEFGDSILQATVKLGEAFGGLGNVLNTVWKFLQPLTVGVAAYSVVVLAATAATKLWALSTAASAEAIKAMAVRLATVTPVAAALVAGFTVGSVIFNQDEERRIEKIRVDLEKIAALRFDALRSLNQDGGFKDYGNELKNRFEILFRENLDLNSKTVRTAALARDASIQSLKEITEQTRVAGKTFFDAINKNLGRLRESANEAKEIIKRSLKSTEQEARKIADAIFATRTKFASEGRLDPLSGMVVGEQQTAVIKARINELISQAKVKFKEGTKESVDEARRLFGEAEKLTTELFDKNTAIRKREFDETIRRGTATPAGIDFDPVTGQMRQRFEFTVRTVEVEKQLKALAEQKLALESQLRQIKKEEMSRAEALESREKNRVNTIKQAIEAMDKLKVFNEKGELLPTLKGNDAEGKDKLDKVMPEFRRLQAIATKAASELELRTNLQTLEFIKKQGDELSKQVQIAKQMENAANREVEIRQKGLEIQDKITKAMERQRNAVTGIEKDVGQLIVEIGTIAATNDPGLSKFFDVKEMFGWNEATQLRKRAELLKELAREQLEIFQQTKTPEDKEKSLAALDAFIKKYKEYIEVRSGKKFEDLPEGSVGKKQLEEIERLRESINKNEEINNKAKLDLLELDRLSGGMVTNLQQSIDVWRRISKAASDSVPSVQASLDAIIGRVGDLVNEAQNAANILATLGGVPPAEVPPKGKTFFGGQPRTYAFGGRGSDDQLAYINRREEVMTGTAVDNWAPLLRAFNAGLTPNQLMGGSRTTSVGDININMSGNNPPDQNVRTFAKSLRRALRRGTVSLD